MGNLWANLAEYTRCADSKIITLIIFQLHALWNEPRLLIIEEDKEQAEMDGTTWHVSGSC
jgi:hypothetical protein